MRDTHTDGNGRLYRLETPEWVAHSTTLAAILLTYLLSWGTVELNPVARRLFDALGYPATAAVAMLEIGAAFGILRRLEEVDRRVALAGGWLIAGVGLADVCINLWRLSSVGFPETTRVEVVATIVVAGALSVAVLGLVGARKRVTSTGLELVETVPTYRLKQGATVAITLLVVTSPLAYGIGLISLASNPASAAGAEMVDDFEDGDLSEWTHAAGEITSSIVYEGSYALKAKEDTSNTLERHGITNDISDKSPDSISWYVQINSTGSSFTTTSILDSGSDAMGDIEYNSDSSISFYTQDRGVRTTIASSTQQDKWYKISYHNITWGGEMTVTIYDPASGEVVGSEDVLMESDSDNFDRFDMNTVDPYVYFVDNIAINEGAPGNTISGTVTDSDGVALDNADVIVEDSSETVASTTTDSSGSYSTNVPSGDYTVTASASGFLSKSKTKSVSSDSSVDFTLTENAVSGTVVSQSGDPVAGQTVQVFGMNYSHPDIESAPDPQQEARDILSSYLEAAPDSWDDTLAPVSDIFESEDANYVAVTTESVSGDGIFTGDDLANPQIQVPADEEIILTEWDPTQTGGLGGQNAWDEQLPGTLQHDGEIVIEQVSAGNDTLSRTTVETTEEQTSGGVLGFGSTTANYATASLNPGFYRVYPEGSPGTAYPIQVGSLGDAATASTSKLIAPNLEDDSGQLAEAAKDEAEALANNKMVQKTTVSKGDGSFSVQLPNNVETVSVQVVGTQPGEVVDEATGETTVPDAPTRREAIQSVEEWSTRATDPQNATSGLNTSTFYMSSSPRIVDVPSSDVSMQVIELSAPGFTDVGDQINKSEWRDELLSNLSYADLPTQLLENISALENRTALNNLTSVDRERLEELYGDLENLSQRNSNLEDRVKQLLGERNATTSADALNESLNLYLNATDATNPELVERVTSIETALSQLEETIDVGDGETTVSGETVSWVQSFDTDLSPENVLVRAHYTNGSVRTLSPGSEYVSINSRPGLADEVEIRQLPLGDAAGAALSVDVATEDGTGGDRISLPNPTYDGTMPALDAVAFSSLRPGPRETVTGTLKPASSSPAIDLEAVSVVGPDGAEVPSTINGTRTLQFTTNGSGAYAVRSVFSTPNGANHTLTQYVEAGSSSVEMKPGVRVETTPFGPTAVVGDGLTDGGVELSEGGTAIDVVAMVPAESEAPDALDVHLSALSLPPDSTVSVRLAKGAAEQSIGKHVETTVHFGGLGDGTLLYRNGEPLPDDSTLGEVIRGAGSSTIKTHTDDQATLEIERNADPSIWNQISYQVATAIPDFSLGLQLGGLPLGGLGAGPSTAALAIAPVGGVLLAQRRRS
ncbi:carboxypeptidase-like regulatory domain-containing protein [Halosimplex pelagicum]|uniref:Carboxypeptidase regulatory-like domain-containing protein n=1 Tax=Halosimplex pelagicum TaxID=869886 RepID=A0A7D5P8G2_9EURY|nr:carboxypeptidase-like regulatory domain-containing protein [Halosimplex pelagicum]QLH83406.1 carboxypeptidase regulatory-like domain-containing protein [Halosimplex pelagicum]